MAIHVALNHLTRYTYDRLVTMSPHVIRLRPAPHTRTPILAYSLNIQPSGYFINWQQDPFGNYLARIIYPEKVKEFTVEVDLIVDMVTINPFDFFLEEDAETYPFTYEAQLKKDLAPYLKINERGAKLKAWLKEVDLSERRVVDFIVDINSRLQKDIAYTIRMEPGVQSCKETLTKRTGSCRDSAWLAVQVFRHLGLAARFVSGYLIQLTPDVKSLDGPSGPTADFTDLHAWVEVYLPGAGWVGLDPTSGLLAGEGHVPLACTPDPQSAAAITGAVDECETEFYYHNQVQRIQEDPRVTKPYSEHQWQLINALGHQVDADLQALDVRLTMGGEPTFVSVDDMDGAEWTTAALGAAKRRLGGNLLLRLRDRFGPGGVLHYGQGKWYPGEPLPRWALSCYWRRDGQPIWKDEAWLADDTAHYHYHQADAEKFLTHLARRLGVPAAHIVPAYEDLYYALWQEGNLPINVDPLKANLKDDIERRRLAQLLERGLGNVASHLLPLKWQFDSQDGYWRSSHWPLRRERLFLTPGDSPAGLRLPLSSLPWLAPEKRDTTPERSLFEELPPLSADGHLNTASQAQRLRYHQDHCGEVARQYSQTVTETPLHPEIHEQIADDARYEDPHTLVEVVHTALCAQVRHGAIYLFMPPLTHLEHWMDLIAKIEATAAELKMPVFLEGYEPPRDWRLNRLSVTPDPGVIEVNIQPASSWDELVHNTEALYEEAHYARLGAEKFMLDGRHTGTGGGNHVTLGGPTPADSPMLRRPDLLGSMISYWQHHPSLSYLFSGLFIGPTSQAPRLDEARNESLYEMEIALQQLPVGEVPQPWLVDRLFRHLLIDLTGNTHRAEFCIDKLYSPDSSTGRLGLLEMRAFEMPPHARMSLMQMLLLRALVARFWQSPYRRPLVRWGTSLHDRWMLPHFIQQDIKDVVLDLQAHGYPFQLDWLAPFMEFRFPHYGQTRVGDIHLELRLAIEPWHVMGEETSNVGTARFVDSSVERVQVKVTGLTDSRYVVACNGRQVPLHNTGTHGEYVAGVRYKAWQPPSALHPRINAHVPLVFDIIDTWHGRSIGGCTYHVAHPGGRNPEIFPINAYEAESRRIARFESFGHTPGTLEVPPEWRELSQFFPTGHVPGPMSPPPEERNPDYPYTLDLRRMRG